MSSICGAKYEQTLNGYRYVYVCVERPGHDWEDGTMHEAETLCNGPVNW